MDDLRTLALRLLERRPPPGPVVSPEHYWPGSLADLIEALSHPETELTGPAWASLCLKYFYAYVFPETVATAVALADVTRLLGRFARRRGGSPDLAGQDDLRRFLLHHGFALQMLADLPKTAHLLAALTARFVPLGDNPFVGLDLGAGTGILLLGQYLLARRSGYERWSLRGLEVLPQVADRADALLSRLSVGRVVQADATKAAAYAELAGAAVACLTNETLPSAGRRLYKEPFPAINQALFAALGPGLAGAVFLPEAVWASDRMGTDWLRLSPENAFAGDRTGEGPGKPLRLYFMRDVELSGRRIPVERVGEAYVDLVSEPWRQVLGRRW